MFLPLSGRASQFWETSESLPTVDYGDHKPWALLEPVLILSFVEYVWSKSGWQLLLCTPCN